MTRLIVTAIAFVEFLCLPSAPEALTLDASALSSSTGKQAFVSLQWYRNFGRVDVATEGKYLTSTDRPKQWDAGVSTVTYLPWGVRNENEYREFHDHRAFTEAAGYGLGPLTLTAGTQTEWDDVKRTTFARAAARLRYGGTRVSTTASLEYLDDTEGTQRWDYRAKYEFKLLGFLSLWARAEGSFGNDEDRSTDLQAAGLGITF